VSETDRDLVLSYAGHAFTQWLEDDQAGAIESLTEMRQRCGDHSIAVAACGWIDTAATAAGLGGPGAYQLKWYDTEGQSFGDASDVPPETRWAGQLMGARAALDEPMFYAIWNSAPWPGSGKSSTEIGRYILMLLDVTTATYRGGRAAQDQLTKRAQP